MKERGDCFFDSPSTIITKGATNLLVFNAGFLLYFEFLNLIQKMFEKTIIMIFHQECKGSQTRFTFIYYVDSQIKNI
jgi:hypothetical protein